MRALLVLPLLLAGCTTEPSVVEGRSSVEPGASCVPAPAVADGPSEGLPALPPGTTVTAAGKGTVSGRVPAPVDDVVEHFRAAMDRAGYVVQREEDEGRAVRLAFFGARGDATLDVALLTCPAGSAGFTLTVRTPGG